MVFTADSLAPPPVVLTVAGSDCCAGAGIQADLKTFAAHDTYGLTAVTAVVAETPQEVRAVLPVSPEILRAQLDLLLASYPVAAMKTGLLPSPAHVETVAAATLPEFLVVDPISVASTGTALGEGDLVGAFVDLLCPRAILVTPNLAEAEALLQGAGVRSRSDVEAAAAELVERLGCSVLLKGGHLEDGEGADDFLSLRGGGGEWILGSRIAEVEKVAHGTGCTLSAAIAAGLAHGRDLHSAILAAKSYLARALEGGFIWKGPDGRDIGGLNHGR